VKKKDGNIIELNEKASSDNSFDPYKNRKVEHPTTSWDTFFHLLKGSLGTG
jgi:proton-coupled amino acid transporter